MKKRIYEIVRYYNLSMRGFEERCYLSRGNLSNMSPEGAIGSDKLAKIIANCEDINPEWLLTGEGEMLKPSTATVIENETAPRPESSTRYIAAIEAENKELKAENKKLYKQIGALESENNILKKGGVYRRVGEGRSAAM